MAGSVTVSVRDDATRLVDNAQARLSQRALSTIAGRAGQNFVRRHFYGLDRDRPNQLGGDRTHFYGQAARGTTFRVDPEGPVISVNQVGIRQRIEGGRIEPRDGKYLTIPRAAEAYGRRAREFGDLKFGFVEDESGRNRPALVQGNEHWGDGDDLSHVMYWLVPSVMQKPDPSVMPDIGALRLWILHEMEKAVRIRAARTARTEGNEGNQEGAAQ